MKLLVTTLLFASTSALAYQPRNLIEDVAYCRARHPAVDRAACLLEQKYARRDLANDELDLDYKPDYYANRFERCQYLRETSDVLTCAERVRSGRTYGDVEAGGTITILRKDKGP